MITLLIKQLLGKGTLKFHKGKGSFTIPLGTKLKEDKSSGKKHKSSSFRSWNRSLHKSK